MAKADTDNSRKDVGTASNADIIEEARIRFAYVDDVDEHNRKAALDDTRFVYERGAQWDAETTRKRKEWKLPCLQFNQLRQFVAQVVNDQRQGRPGVRFYPMSDGASDKVAKLKQELVRGIEVKSDAEAAYDTGFQHAVVGGRGYWRVRSDYESRKSFNQCLIIDRLSDPQSVRLDPDYQRADAADAQWAFVLESVKKDDYKRRYKGTPLSWSPGAETRAWYPDEETVIVADYYRLVTSERELLLLADGRVVWDDEYEDAKSAGYPVPEVVERRDGEHVRCEWYTLAGGEKVVKRNPWRGSFVPVILCAGDEIVIDGKRHYQGLIRHARDPQALLNYSMTQIAMRLASTPRAPYLAAVEAIAGHENLYANANDENYGVLPYNHLSSDGNPIPPPQRQQGSDIDAGWANWVQQMQMQVRSTIGMYESSLGMRGQEVSGKAILAKERQGDNATFHFIDNLKRAITHTGRVLDDLIPHYYDSERLVSLVEQDGTQHLGPVNAMKPVPDPETEGAVRYIKDPDNDLTRGEYAVAVESGPSDSTKREQTRETLVELFQAFPPAAQVLGDKLMQVIDMPEAREAAERFKALLPPQIQQMEAAKEQGQRPPDPQMMAQLQQLQGQLQQAGQAVQQLQAENQQLKQDQQVKMADAQMDAQVAREKAALDAKTKVDTKLIDVAGNLLAEHMGLRAQAAATGGPAPPPVGLGEIVQGLQGTVEQVKESAETGSPMPVPAMHVPEPGPSPDAVVILEGVNQIVGRMVEALTAPRAMQVQTDAAGNVIGGVSVPVSPTMQ